MAEEAHRSQAAQISVTRNGEADKSNEEVFHRDVPHNASSGPITSQSHNSPENYAMNEGVVQVGPYTGASREQQMGGAVVLADDIKSPAIEKLELVRKWSINTYKCTKQILSEKLGRGSRTVDLELEAQIEILRENKRKYEHVIKLAQTLCTQLAQMMQTQRQLGDAFADLSLKTPELHEEFGYNAETQKLLAKNGETLLGAINFFISSVKTLVDKTIEDTLINIKQYEAARIEYDAYRTDLEELNLGPRDATTLPKIELSQQQFQIQREKYERMRNDVSVKLKFLEENKVLIDWQCRFCFAKRSEIQEEEEVVQSEHFLCRFKIEIQLHLPLLRYWSSVAYLAKTCKPNFQELDRFTQRFIHIFKAKGGDIGCKLKKILQQIENEKSEIIGRRTAVLHGLPLLLRADPTDFYKTCFDCDDKGEMSGISIGILFVIPEDSATVPYCLHLDATFTAIILEGEGFTQPTDSLPQRHRCILRRQPTAAGTDP